MIRLVFCILISVFLGCASLSEIINTQPPRTEREKAVKEIRDSVKEFLDEQSEQPPLPPREESAGDSTEVDIPRK